MKLFLQKILFIFLALFLSLYPYFTVFEKVHAQTTYPVRGLTAKASSQEADACQMVITWEKPDFSKSPSSGSTINPDLVTYLVTIDSIDFSWSRGPYPFSNNENLVQAQNGLTCGQTYLVKVSTVQTNDHSQVLGVASINYLAQVNGGTANKSEGDCPPVNLKSRINVKENGTKELFLSWDINSKSTCKGQGSVFYITTIKGSSTQVDRRDPRDNHVAANIGAITTAQTYVVTTYFSGDTFSHGFAEIFVDPGDTSKDVTDTVNPGTNNPNNPNNPNQGDNISGTCHDLCPTNTTLFGMVPTIANAICNIQCYVVEALSSFLGWLVKTILIPNLT